MNQPLIKARAHILFDFVICESIDSCVLTLPQKLKELPTQTSEIFPHHACSANAPLDHAVRIARALWRSGEVEHQPNAEHVYILRRKLRLQTKNQPKGLAVEPGSCPPDAFNSGIALIHLCPKAIHQLHFQNDWPKWITRPPYIHGDYSEFYHNGQPIYPELTTSRMVCA